MKKLIFALLLTPIFCLGQISEYSKEIKKNFFPKQKFEVINSDHPYVHFIKTEEGQVFAVAIGQSVDKGFARTKNKADLVLALKWIYGGVEKSTITDCCSITKEVTLWDKRNRIWAYLALYSLPGETRINGELLDPQKILN